MQTERINQDSTNNEADAADYQNFAWVFIRMNYAVVDVSKNNHTRFFCCNRVKGDSNNNHNKPNEYSH